MFYFDGGVAQKACSHTDVSRSGTPSDRQLFHSQEVLRFYVIWGENDWFFSKKWQN
jgi:hypothetical protein